MSSLRDRLTSVRERVQRAAERAGRDPSEITLVAVSKTVAPEQIVEANRLGQMDFGENRVQEFRAKRAHLDAAGIRPRYHLVGHLQSNKAKAAWELFDIIHSVDSTRLARVLALEAARYGRRASVLLEVDFSDDPGRPGFDPGDLASAGDELATLDGLEVLGLMTVAPLGLDESGVRAVFRRMRALREELRSIQSSVEWHHLSMGMSDDFELAIEEGATIIRVGRAIFGDRPAVR